MAMVPSSRPLYLVCTWKEVLQLTKPYSLQKTCGSTKRRWTWTRLDLWSTQEDYVFPAWLAQQIFFTTSDRNHRSLYPLMPHWPSSPQRDVSTELVSTRGRGFSGSLPVDMWGIRGWILSPVFYFHGKEFSSCIPGHDHNITWNNECFHKTPWCCSQAKTTHNQY
jgi:hypothetical protein